MALPSTGSISMAQVRTELGLSGSISLGQSQVRNLAGRSTGSVSMSHLRGKSAWDGTLVPMPSSVTASTTHPTDPLVQISFLPSGEIRRTVQTNETNMGTYTPSGSAAGGETQIRYSVIEGNVTTNGASGWSSLALSRIVRLTRTTVGTSQAKLIVELRNSNNTSQVVEKLLELRVTKSSLPPPPPPPWPPNQHIP